jgi:Secretion system C-terminal sorting domain
MKIFTSKFFLALIFFLFTITYLKAQHAEDPITNVYKVGGSAEIIVGYSTTGNAFTKQGILDIPESLNDIVKKEDASQFKFMSIRKTASATGDFNGDGADNVVTVRDSESGGIKITIPFIGEDLIMDGESVYVEEELNTMAYTRLRICTGNFDRDIEDEFVLCYGYPGEALRVYIFETDEDLNITLLDKYESITYYDHLFDIAAGDMDGDGIDEIAVLRNEGLPTENSTAVNPPIFISHYDIYVLEYDTLAKEIVALSKTTPDYEVVNPQMPSGDWWYSPNNILINEMRISCGDLNLDGRDEMVVGWSNYYSHDRYWVFGYYYRYQDALFLNTFRLDPVSSDIENMQNMYLGSTYFGERSFPASQDITLSLKCEQLDNLGRPEVLISGSSALYVLGSAGSGMDLEVKSTVSGSGGYLNIGGNENIIVADLNPDTATLNFHKEVVLLLSDQSTLNQLNKVADEPLFEILTLDSISADTVAFASPGPPHDLPFGDLDIEVSAMQSGDFDLKNAAVYMIGTPEIIPVSRLQYPLVILNAPPVHFDVLNGVRHDLCDAFIDDANPTFSALYNTRVEDRSTTSIDVSNSMGFSADFRAYSMAGGSGFEASVSGNFEMGQSYYQAKSHSTSIEEEKEVYTEDFVLYSNLDYLYYKYPVYNELKEKIGDIAVLNPESENFSSVWGSGNSWDHPGYTFNHETGNILSYRPYIDENEFCTRAFDFTSCEFSRVPVTNTGNGSFNFTFENISSEGNSFSFSSGVGASLFTKVGVEATLGTEVGFLGTGVTVETEVRAGVSFEISSRFSASKLSNHSTELSDAFQIDGQIGRLNENYDNVARYNITPYIYRSQSGALVLDYAVNLDESNKDWWEDNYGQKPDLAFILPWRYAVEKGSDHIKPSKLQKTSEIQFYPPVVAPGDTVCITARVHNYSLLTFENNLKLNFYLGDPENGGVKLTDIDGLSESSKYSTMMYYATEANLDFEDYLTFLWQVPDTVSCSPRIYAVIDEGDEYSEIHEDNNTGWNTLTITECTECLYAENYIGIEDKAAEVFHLETYPTPVSDYSRIRFDLPFAENVLIEVFSMSGQKVGTVTDAYYPAGEQEVEFYAGDLSDGLYFYRFTAGSSIGTSKLIVMKQ